LTLNTIAVGPSAVGTELGQTTGSAVSIAAAINAVSSQSGVTATATAATWTGGSVAVPAAGTNITSGTVNGVPVGDITYVAQDSAAWGADIAAAFNAVSSTSGVTATADGTTGAVTLTAADGRDILLGTAYTAANSGFVGSATVPKQGTVNLSSKGADLVIGGAASGPDKAGLTAGTTAATLAKSISQIDVTSAENARSALDAIDGALATVNSSRASLGAIQNRFTSVVTSLQTTSENLSASRSRIQDADFAAETANLSRSQILQQAGTAMVAQANQLPQSVLSLLK